MISSPKSNEIALREKKPSRRALARQTSDHNQIAMLEFQSPTAALIAAPIPFMSRALVWILASMLACIVALLALVQVDQVVTADGSVVSLTPNIVLQPLEVSIVRSINVHDGQLVHKGDVLASLDPTVVAGDDKSTAAQQASLAAEVARLRAELDGKPYVTDGSVYGNLMASMYIQRTQEYRYHVDSLTQKIESARAKVDAAHGDAKSAADRLVGLRDAEARRVELEHLQVGSHLNTLTAKDAVLQMQSTLADAQAAERGATQDLASATSDLADYIHQWHSDTSQQLIQQERLLSDMTGQAIHNTVRHGLVELHAPEDAIVLSIARVSVGTVMQSGDEFIRLVPADAPLGITADIQTDEIGFTKVGDPATIKFATLPFMLYGTAEGTVQYISADSFTAPTQSPQLQAPSTDPSAPTESQTTYFRARISLDHMKLINVPPSFRLQPGMPVMADIKVGQRSVLQYLLARVAPTFTTGMREP